MDHNPPEGHIPAVVDTPGDEPCAQIWSVYISEAEKYDKALVDSWRGNMNGILIFAGLFSAILTSFIIQSYQSLQPDPMLLSLAHISQQLANATNTSPIPPSIYVHQNLVVCNILWFISLGLSLASALTATLVDQWARDFLQRTEMLPSPVKRARIFSYLYYVEFFQRFLYALASHVISLSGLQYFRMHAVVAAIPLLLHMSLLLFFGGLVAFLSPVSPTMAIVAAGILAVVVIFYLCLTILPLIQFDCPYKTPLSTVLWSIRKYYSLFVLRHELKHETATDSLHLHSMVYAMVEKATVRSDEREERDKRALAWTMKSLADDDELEPFVEGIPNAIWGPDGRRRKYDNLIRGLLNDPEVLLGSRIEHLMLSCESGLLDPISKTRRQISCLKAIWCLGMMAENDLRPIQPLFFLTGSRFLPPKTPVTAQYFPSIDALAHWNNLCSLQGHVDKINRSLQEGGEALAQDRVPDIKRYCDELKDFLTERSRCKWSGRIPIAVEGVDLDLHQLSAQSTIASFQWIFKVSRIMRALRSITSETQDRAACWNEVHYQIVLSFLQQSAALDNPPYEFELTCKTLLASLERKNLPAGFVAKVVEDNVRKAAQTKNSSINHVDTILGILLPWFDNDEVESDVAEHVTDSVVEFVNNRDLNKAICRVLQDCNLTRVWNRSAARVETCRPDCRGDVSKAMWHLAILFPGQSNPGPRLNARPNFNGRTLSVVCVDPYSPSVIALLKMRILSAFEQTHIRSNLQAIETSIMGNVQTAVEDKLSTMAHDWPLLCAVCTLLSPITTSGPPIQPLELFPAYTRQNQGYREWCEQALAVVRKALRLTPHLEGRFEEARLAITTEFMQACLNADDSPLPYNALETFNDILLPVSISYPAHRDNQRNFATALRELAGCSTRTSEHLELLRAVIESGIFGVEGLPWLSDHEAVATVKSVIQKYLALVDGEATTTTQSRRLENVLNWLELKEVDYVSDFLHPLALNHVGTSKLAY